MPDQRDDARELDRLWNDLASGWSDGRGYAVSPGTSETIRAFQELATRPPAKVSRDRVDRAVFAALDRAAMRERPSEELVVLTGAKAPFAANGASHPVPLRSIPSQRPWWSRVSGTALATAALALLALAGSIAIMAPRRHGEPEPPAVLVAPAAGPVAEFLWQATGEPDARLTMPAGVGVDPHGNVWVTDGNKGHLVIFSPEGDMLETFGSRGDGQGQFNFSCGEGYGGVAFDAVGNIYVADAGNGRIQQFGPDRAFLTSWPVEDIVNSQLLVTGRGSQGDPDEQRACPSAIAIDPRGRVVVSDRMANEIKVFDLDGSPILTAAAKQMRPEGVALDGDGAIWVADNANRVLQFSPDGRLLAEWGGTAGQDDRELYVPMTIAVDALGRVFVADWGNRVQVFAPDGAFLGAWGSANDGEWLLTDPVGLALDGSGHVYVVNHAPGQLQKFRLLPPLGP